MIKRIAAVAVAAVTAGAGLLLAFSGGADAATRPPVPVIRYTPVQPTCHASQAGQVGVIAGDGWHMFPARCDIDGEIYVWDTLPMPAGSNRGDRRLCRALATFNAAGIPGRRDLGRLAYRGLYARGWYRLDAGALVGAIVKGHPFMNADLQLQRDCGQD